jgi:hypothetical protein
MSKMLRGGGGIIQVPACIRQGCSARAWIDAIPAKLDVYSSHINAYVDAYRCREEGKPDMIKTMAVLFLDANLLYSIDSHLPAAE